MEKKVGKNTIGDGKKMTVQMKDYGLSTHNLTRGIQTTMSPGTLNPIYKLLVTKGDHLKIKILSSVLTAPANGPQFGSFKLQIDGFYAEMRLYQSMMQNNELEQGLKMEEVTLPQLELTAPNNYGNGIIDSNSQTHPSSCLAQLGIRGIGHATEDTGFGKMTRQFHATAWLMFWDCYKNYYANKQEKVGYFIHNTPQDLEIPVNVQIQTTGGIYEILPIYPSSGDIVMDPNARLQIRFPLTTNLDATRPENYDIIIGGIRRNLMEVWSIATQKTDGTYLYWELSGIRNDIQGHAEQIDYIFGTPILPPLLKEFDLKNLDQMRREILMSESGVEITRESITPYGDTLYYDDVFYQPSTKYSQEGLPIKTYQSDMNNNWINTEWIDSINEQTSVSTDGGSFTMDALAFANKLWELQNRIGLSGGSIDDWEETVWGARGGRNVLIPEYIGGASREVKFQQVISTAQTEMQPLGQLGGRGVTYGDGKGGYVEYKVPHAGYIMFIASLTPRIVYSQGNDWDNNLKTMDDLHKPQMDGIGFQDLITDQFDWRDTGWVDEETEPIFKSVGKQPAWTQYTTDVNRALGNFAIENSQMFMVLNRRYEWTDQDGGQTKDKTTYIDPSKFNYVFTETALDAQNFWCEFLFEIEARRVMSARQMPTI